MIKEAILAHPAEARAGIGRATIKKYIQSHHPETAKGSEASFNTRVNQAITRGAEKKTFVLPKGPSGKVKLAPKAKVEKKPAAVKKPAAKKVAAKKPAAKKPAAKKVSPPRHHHNLFDRSIHRVEADGGRGHVNRFSIFVGPCACCAALVSRQQRAPQPTSIAFHIPSYDAVISGHRHHHRRAFGPSNHVAGNPRDGY